MNLVLCAYGHLPSGTADEEFENLYNTEIKPLISALDKFPRINMMLHYSGVILYWIERRHPEFFMLIEDLLSRKQMEFLGGGFYNPAFSLLPQADKNGQIEMLTDYLRKHFGKRPQGCWLPALAWEQNLVGPLNSYGMSYTFLEDLQFSAAGAEPYAEGVYLPCITEEQGKLITVFPVYGTLGKELSQGKPLEILGKFLEGFSQNDESHTMVIPVVKTDYENLFAELSKADPKVKFTCPSKFFKNLKSLKKAYFPGVWSGNETNPRQFLADYPEAGCIYAKMMNIHTLITNQLRGDKTRKRTAIKELWKAQDSGIFRLGSPSIPGLFHSPVRKAAYQSLLEAERIIREKKKFSPSLSVFDFDLDGEGEFIFQDDRLNCCIKTLGAGVFELDYLPCTWNYLDTLAVKTETLKGERRSAFVDWLAPAALQSEDIGTEGVKGGRFCGLEEFKVSDTDRVHRRVVFTLPPKPDLPWGEIEIVKTWQHKKNSLALEYVLRNTGTETMNFTFCTSVDLSFPGETDGFLRIYSLHEGEKEHIASNAHTIGNVKTLEFQDINNESIIVFESGRSFDGRLFHVHSGFPGHEEYQSTCVMPLFPVTLEAGKTWKTAFSLKISS